MVEAPAVGGGRRETRANRLGAKVGNSKNSEGERKGSLPGPEEKEHR